jgi:hypothetical protein
MEWFFKNKTQTLPTKILGTTSMTWSKIKNPHMKQIFGNKFVAWSAYHKILKSTVHSKIHIHDMVLSKQIQKLKT